MKQNDTLKLESSLNWSLSCNKKPPKHTYVQTQRFAFAKLCEQPWLEQQANKRNTITITDIGGLVDWSIGLLAYWMGHLEPFVPNDVEIWIAEFILCTHHHLHRSQLVGFEIQANSVQCAYTDWEADRHRVIYYLFIIIIIFECSLHALILILCYFLFILFGYQNGCILFSFAQRSFCDTCNMCLLRDGSKKSREWKTQTFTTIMPKKKKKRK